MTEAEQLAATIEFRESVLALGESALTVLLFTGLLVVFLVSIHVVRHL